MKRYYSLHTRVSEQEFLAMNMIATREGLTVSEALRYFIRMEFTRQGLLVGMLETRETFPVLSKEKNGQPQ
jgi:hypothetical protein